jgi:multicomponent Na+:H+ antiporter subunit D
MFTPQTSFLIPIIFLLMSLVIPLIGWLGRTRAYIKFGTGNYRSDQQIIPPVGSLSRAWAYITAVVVTALGFILSLTGLHSVLGSGTMSYHMGGWAPPMGIEFVLDPLSAFMVTILTGVSLLVLIHSKNSLEKELPKKVVPFYSLSMILLAGLCGMVMTGDLFNLYVFLEIAALSGYALLAIGDKKAYVSSFRYLTLGTAGASFYLIGLAFIFMSTGSLNMADIADLLPMVQHSTPVVIGMILIVLGIGLKMALFPMHAWLPDAYTYASSTATALIAPIGTKVAAYILIRIMFFVAAPAYVHDELNLTYVVGYLGAVGIIWGSIMAICQKELKRMLAYSSVAQVGYIALGIGLASPLGFVGAILHILNHACMKACLFLISGNLRLKLGHSTIPEFTNSLSRSMPWTSAAFTVAAISMIGLPPTAGFFSKWYLALGSIEQSNWLFLAALLISSLLNAVYFFRIIEKMYLKPRHAKTAQAPEGEAVVVRNEAPFSMLAPAMILALGLFVLGIMNVFIVENVIRLMIPGGL